MFGCELYHLWDESRFVCAHIGQKRDIYPPSIFCLHFWLVPPSPYSAGSSWGLLSRIIFYFFVSPIRFLLVFYFFYFSDFVTYSFWFWLSDYRLIVSIFNLLILTRFGYAWLSSSTCLIFARYSLSVLRYILLASISTRFSIVYSML